MVSLKVCVVVVMFLIGAAVAKLDTKIRNHLLKLHNDGRAGEGSSDMNQLVWDDELEREAQQWADGCRFEHQMGERGENLAFNTEEKPDTELSDGAYKAWFDEKNQYSYGQRSCGSTGACHYTQLVWAATRRVGCGIKRCGYLSGGAANSWYLVCFYDPKGNMNGEKPYEKGSACSKCRKDQQCGEKLCKGGADPCEDSDDNCDMWANKMNQCTQNKKFMKDKCSLSCKFCKGGSGDQGGQKPNQEQTDNKEESKDESKDESKTEKQGDCEDKHRVCTRWASRGECKRNPGYMKRKCPKSCNTCSDSTECYDSHNSCRPWAERGECDRSAAWMKEYCMRSCGVCADTSKEKSEECKDGHQTCPRWAQAGECSRNPGWMNNNCKKACGVCGASCKDLFTSCRDWASRGECYYNERWMNNFCSLSCGCRGGGGGGSCKDSNTSCARWASRGECENNPNYMKHSCKKSCKTC